MTSPGDRAALIDLLTRFASGIDTRKWTLYRSAFTDEIDLDYSSWRPESIGRWRADEWVAHGPRIFPGLTFSRHTLTNHTVTVGASGDSASVRANVCAEHVIVEGDSTDVFTLNGYYDDRCVRTTEGWRITGKTLVVQWCTGDVDVMRRARERAAELLAGND